MHAFQYLRPTSLEEAAALLGEHAQARLLAGGQSLLAAMKLGLSAPTHLIDLQDVPGLGSIRLHGDSLDIGAMASHAQVAASPVVRAFSPMLAQLAGGIADQQVRQVGTLGGSLANNDPAACWPAGILALDARLATNQRDIAADDFFQGLYATALRPGEVLTGVRFRRPAAACYMKHAQPASHFALVGVAVARFDGDTGDMVRVAVTGLGQGVLRWPQAEQALCARWSVAALDELDLPVEHALGDIHASAGYRAHLTGVMARRAVAAMTGESPRRGYRATPAPVASRKAGTNGTRAWLAQLEHFLHSLFRR